MSLFHDFLAFMRDVDFLLSGLMIPAGIFMYRLWKDNKKRKEEEKEWKERMDEEVKRLDDITDLTDEYREIIKMLLRSNLKNRAAQYLQRGVLSSDELTTYHDIFGLYEKIGGNGVAKSLTKQVDKLPVDDTGNLLHEANIQHIKNLIHLLETNPELQKELKNALEKEE